MSNASLSKYLLLFSFFFTHHELAATNWYVSADGSSQNTGLAPDSPIASIGQALESAQSADTVFLMPGTFPGRTYLKGKHGTVDRPIVLRSFSNDPAAFAIIDAQSLPTKDGAHEGLVLEKCSWITIENIIFRRCWPSVVHLINSSYVSIRQCHFTSGRRVVYPTGHDAHHVLVENCYVKHPDEVWNGWSWEELHHGAVEYYNGALLHPWRSGGGHVMRGNTCLKMFNVFRTRPKNISEDGNTEIYDNVMIDIRDNDFEPETWAWNMFYYHNRHQNIHKIHSIDNVKGGNIYIFGNTYTQTDDPWAVEEVSGIYKYSSYDSGSLTYPCYVFNNSFYTEANVLRHGESTNHQLKHFNNAYHFFDGSQNFKLTAWQPGFEFDYDCINQDWPPNIQLHDQEQNGLTNTDPGFKDPANGDLRLKQSSPLIDKGKIMSFPNLEWSQRYDGAGPDIGAYDGNKFADGPPFRFVASPEGSHYEELPRITKHLVDGNRLHLFFSAALQTSAITKEDVLIFEAGKAVIIDSIGFPSSPYEMVLHSRETLNMEALSLQFNNKPTGINGQPFTYWASTIPIGQVTTPRKDISTIAIEPVDHQLPLLPTAEYELTTSIDQEKSRVTIILTSTAPLPKIWVDRLAVYSADRTEKGYYPKRVHDREYHFEIDLEQLLPGRYEARLRVARMVLEVGFLYGD